MTCNLAIHLPNRKLESSELARIRAVGCSAYIVYVPFLGDWPYWVSVCQQIRTTQPAAQIHLRLEKRGDLGNPSDEANQAATIANHFTGFIDTYTWRNEPNNNQEAPTSLTAATWKTWLTTFLANARILSTVPVAAPPVSPGDGGGSRDSAGFLSATADAARSAGVKILHGHAYGSPDVAETDMYKLRQVWSDRIVITEHNFGYGNVVDLNQYVRDIPEVCRRAAKYSIECVAIFIWFWDHPD